jgi:hypothetical protein
MPSAGFEPTIPAIKWPQTYALDGTSTGISIRWLREVYKRLKLWVIKVVNGVPRDDFQRFAKPFFTL